MGRKVAAVGQLRGCVAEVPWMTIGEGGDYRNDLAHLP